MKYRKLGNSGMYISEIGFGSLFYGGAQWNATDNPVSREEALICLKKAWEGGINHIDCADIYGGFGPAEKIIGEFIKDYDRTDFVFASKVFFPMSSSSNDRGLSKKHISEAIDKTLKRMNIEYLDLYYCHRYDYSTPLEETVRAMNDLIDEGKILYWGTSNWFASQLERAWGIAKNLDLRGPVCDQAKYNLVMRFSAEYELPYTAEYTGIGIVAYKVLADGLFTSKYEGKKLEELSDRQIKSILRYIGDEDLKPQDSKFKKILKLSQIAQELDITLAQLAYAWVLSNPLVNSALMGTRHPERIDENLGALEISLTKQILVQIDEILDNRPFDLIQNGYMGEDYAFYKERIKTDPRAKYGKYPFD
ncbi:MAG: aldo/keto reductase [Candidatus Hermodarchaeota archaeon]